MTFKTTFLVALPNRTPIEAEAHSSRKLKKLIVTKLPGQRRTITHRRSGWAITSLLPITMRTIPQLIAFAEALEALDHPAWAILDATTLGGTDRNKMSGRDVDNMRDFVSKARALGLNIVTEA